MTSFIRIILLCFIFSGQLLHAAAEPTTTACLTIDDLKRGDIIVFVRHVLRSDFTLPPVDAKRPLTPEQVRLVQAQEDTSYPPYMDHLALYAGQNHDHNPLILHSTPLAFNPEHPHRPNGLCQTFLKNKVEYDDDLKRYIFYTYDVIRCLNPDIAEAAFTALQTQARFRVPYDQTRLDWKIGKEDEECWDDAQFCEHAMSVFNIKTYLKFLARHLQGKPLTTTSPEGVEKGITCSMAIVIGYNIGSFIAQTAKQDNAKLLKHLVRGCRDNFDKWITCKHSTRPMYVDISDIILPALYEQYKPFAIIPLEPKRAGAGGVVHFLISSDTFEKIGEITTLPSIMETDREARRQSKARASIDAEELRRAVSPTSWNHESHGPATPVISPPAAFADHSEPAKFSEHHDAPPAGIVKPAAHHHLND